MSHDLPSRTVVPGRHQTWLEDRKRWRCDICPRRCELKPGQRGFCFVRQGAKDGIEGGRFGVQFASGRADFGGTGGFDL